MDKVFNILAKTNGLLGIYANVGFGKTTFMLQVVEEINKRKNGTAIIFELEEVKRQIQKRIIDLKIDNERIILCDDSKLTTAKIENYINQAGLVSILCIDNLSLVDEVVASELYNIANKYQIPILFTKNLGRDSGDYDINCRPELYSIWDFRKGKNSIEWNTLDKYSFLAFLHREHKGYRGVGTAERYDISNKTEFIVKRCIGYGPFSAFMEWSEKERRFNY
jgi:hypothetical protein